MAQLSAAAQRLGDLERRRVGLVEAVSDHPDRDELNDLVVSVKQAANAVNTARKEQAAARKAVATAEKAVRDANNKLQEQQSAFHAQRDALGPIDPPAPEGSDLATDWQALVEWAGAQLPLQSEREQAERESSSRLAGESGGKLRRFADAAITLDVSLISTQLPLGDLREAITVAATHASTHVQTIDAALAEQERVEQDVAGAAELQQVAAELARLLSSNNFERWLVAEALHALVTGASETLRRLSGGAYSLACNEAGDFMVVDHHNADERRPVRTLSGGETFQASLALALALADHLVDLAAQGAARLESMFLDEGFGTLDPDTLNTVADTIDGLGHDRRMVGIVTHVRELAERIPVRYVVTKTARTSSVERVTA